MLPPKFICFFSCFLFLAPNSVLAQDPSEICKSPPIIFKDSLIKSKESYKTSYKQLLCSASWGSYQDIVNAGIDTTIPIYNIPVPIEANYSQDKQKEWQSTNCSEEERNSDFSAEGYKLVKEISPTTASAWIECIRTTQQNILPRAIFCKVTETESATVFEAKWRLFEGMKEDDAPIIKSLDILNTKCSNAQALKKGTRLTTGGAAVLCDSGGVKGPIFVLNTDRGSCAANGLGVSLVTDMNGKLELKSSTIFKGESIKLNSNLEIVTNGYNLTIDSKRLVIDGNPSIKSFIGDQEVVDRRGDSAGEIRIVARRVEGGVLTIENFGQNGGKGSDGLKGSTGRDGAPAARRYWKNLKGCVGGNEAGPGGQGYPGGAGNPGASGGNGGDVTLDIGYGLIDGSTERIKVITQRIDRANNPFECGGTCSGLGGLGGKGGPGGDGGRGGAGAGGDNGCGGRPEGPPGPTGPVGVDGPEGRLGSPGDIEIY